MMESTKLPILGSHFQQGDADSCGPTAYVTNEEAAIVAALRGLREQALTIRKRLEPCQDPAERQELSRQLDELRSQRKKLVQHQEAAWRRKMVMLGHLPPDEQW